MDDVLTRWEARVYEAMAHKADEFKAGNDLVTALLKTRDEILATI